MTATFFGHRDTPEDIKEKLRETIIKLIESNEVRTFFVGNEGRFDIMAGSVLKEIKKEYKNISYNIVLSYMPTDRRKGNFEYSETIFPEEVAQAPRKYAIDRRNRWLVEHSDIVVTYVRYSTGGAAKFMGIAEKKGKRIINLAK